MSWLELARELGRTKPAGEAELQGGGPGLRAVGLGLSVSIME